MTVLTLPLPVNYETGVDFTTFGCESDQTDDFYDYIDCRLEVNPTLQNTLFNIV